MKKTLLLFIIPCLLMIACVKSNEADHSAAPPYLPTFVTKTNIDASGTTNTTYRYDDKNRMIVSSGTAFPAGTISYTYDDKDRLIKTVLTKADNSIETKTFAYSGQNVYISWVNNPVINGAVTHMWLALDANGNPVEIHYISLTKKTYDAAGNLQTTKIYGDTTGTNLLSTTTYSGYDNHPAPFSNVNGNFFIYGLNPGYKNVSNQSKVSTTTEGPTGQTNYSTFTNNYTDAGYPANTTLTYVTAVAPPGSFVYVYNK